MRGDKVGRGRPPIPSLAQPGPVRPATSRPPPGHLPAPGDQEGQQGDKDAPIALHSTTPPLQRVIFSQVSALTMPTSHLS